MYEYRAEAQNCRGQIVWKETSRPKTLDEVQQAFRVFCDNAARCGGVYVKFETALPDPRVVN